MLLQNFKTEIEETMKKKTNLRSMGVLRKQNFLGKHMIIDTSVPVECGEPWHRHGRSLNTYLLTEASEDIIAPVVRPESRLFGKTKDKEWITVTKLDPGVRDIKNKCLEDIYSPCPSGCLRWLCFPWRHSSRWIVWRSYLCRSTIELASRPESSHWGLQW